MPFEEKIRLLSETIPSIKQNILNEEATKNSLVLPFINALGYNIFNPVEVMPEFTADVGSKKGEKVDYAICLDNKPIFLFECKLWQNDLSNIVASQLRRYFHVTSARIGILTNGIRYQFFSDLDAANIMDQKPFMELDLENIDDSLIKEVKKLSKTDFKLDAMLSSANDLKYIRQIKALLKEEFNNPSAEFVKFFSSQVYFKKMMPAVLEQFSIITKKAMASFINSEIDQRLKSALSRQPEKLEEEPYEKEDNGIVTTDEEREGYYIVKAILSEKTDPARIFLRDTKSYFGILLDNNNRKPLCRLHFNSKQKYIGIIDQEKSETRIPIESLNEIYSHANKLKLTLALYETGGEKC